MFGLSKKYKPPIDVFLRKEDALVMFIAAVKGTTVMKMNCVEDGGNILIGDIIPYPLDETKNLNKGYGSKLMEALFKYSRDNGIQSVTGNLSVVDLGHKDRLHHFYEKFGFKITEYDKPKGCYYGFIQKEII